MRKSLVQESFGGVWVWGKLGLLLGALVVLFSQGCGSKLVCLNGINSLTLDPKGSQCTSDCDCNNQKFEGKCESGLCSGIGREKCDEKGRKDHCFPLFSGGCGWGVRICQDEGLNSLVWGDCKALSPVTSENTLALCSDGVDNDCDGRVDFGDEDCKGFCLPNGKEPCYSGDEKSLNEGICRVGTKTCGADGAWGACKDEVLPKEEVCNKKDDDCDGLVDEGVPGCESKPCTPGVQQTCYNALFGCQKEQGKYRCKGECRPGYRTCQKDGTWGECTRQLFPKQEGCDGIDNNCDGEVDDGCLCNKGSKQKCYTGPKDTLGKAGCKDGTQTCEDNGRWGPCVGEVPPKAEECNGKDDDCNGLIDEDENRLEAPFCDNQRGVCVGSRKVCGGEKGWLPCEEGNFKAINAAYVKEEGESDCDKLDNDCDGLIDEGCVGGDCKAGASRACYTGPAGTQGKGECKEGLQVCEGSKWGACLQEVKPSAEVCDQKDNDCDGEVDEDCQEGCKAGQSRACYTGPAGTKDKGECKEGLQICSEGKWGACLQEAKPRTEICDGRDEDCDGVVDNGARCPAGQVCVRGACEPGMEVPDAGEGNVEPAGPEEVTMDAGEGESKEPVGPEEAMMDGGTGESVPESPAELPACSSVKEICDGKDNNCNGLVDETCESSLTCPVKSMYARHFLRGHTAGVQAVAVSRDGKWLASGGADKEVHIWDTKWLRLEKKFTTGSAIRGLAFTQDGTGLLVAGEDKSVALWSVQSGQQTWAEANAHSGALTDVALSPDGLRFVTSAADGGIAVWNLANRANPVRLTGHQGAVHAVAWSPDNKKILSGGQDKTLRVWDVATPKEDRKETLSDPVLAVAWSPDGKLLASGAGSQVRLWEAGGTRFLEAKAALAGGMLAVVFDPQSKLLVSSNKSGEVKLWDAAVTWGTTTALTMAHELKAHTQAVSRLAYRGDGVVFFTASEDMTVGVMSCPTFCLPTKFSKSFKSSTRGAYGMFSSPDGSYVFHINISSALQVFEVPSGQAKPYNSGSGNPYATSMSYDNKTIAHAYNWSSLYLKDFPNGTTPSATFSESPTFGASAFSPDGKWFAYTTRNDNGSSNHSKVILYNIASKQKQTVVASAFSFVRGGYVEWLLFSADGKYLLANYFGTGASAIKMWDLTTSSFTEVRSWPRTSAGRAQKLGLFLRPTPNKAPELQLVDPVANKVLQTYMPPTTGTSLLRYALSNNGEVYTAIDRGVKPAELHFWDGITGRWLMKLKLPAAPSGSSGPAKHPSFGPNDRSYVLFYATTTAANTYIYVCD